MEVLGSMAGFNVLMVDRFLLISCDSDNVRLLRLLLRLLFRLHLMSRHSLHLTVVQKKDREV